MQLSDFIKLPGKQVQGKTEHTAVNTDAAKNAQVDRQIKALVPGQTIQGEIVGKNGNEVQIRLSDDMVLSARLDSSMHLEMGKGMTFQVMNNGSSLTLSPLFANTATDVNVFKALDMAGMPVNNTTVAMTQSMMEAGMSIDKQSLQNMFREVNANPQSNVSDIVDLHKLGLPVNQDNLEQIASYKNLTHQLVNGMNNILDEIPMTMQTMIQEGNIEGAIELFHALTQSLEGEEGALQAAVPEAGQEMPKTDAQGQLLPEGNKAAVSGQEMDTLSLLSADGNEQTGKAGGAQTGNLLETQAGVQPGTQESGLLPPDTRGGSLIQSGVQDGSLLPPGTQDGSLLPPDTQDGRLAAGLQSFLEQLNLPASEQQQFSEQLAQLKQGGLSSQELLSLVDQMMQSAMKAGLSEASRKELGSLLTDKSLHQLLNSSLKDNWTIRPEEVQSKEKVDALYNRLNSQLNGLAETLSRVGQSDSNVFKSVANMTQNLDFLQQLNQMYAYVQLPLKMSQDTAHGDLYVYANKKHLASADGNISALLHLDMEHLGPVDVYVVMQNNADSGQPKVSTRFYVKDDEMLDFLAEHMDILNNRLKARGYDMQCEMTVRQPEQKGNPVQTMINESAPSQPLAQYAFDVRA